MAILIARARSTQICLMMLLFLATACWATEFSEYQVKAVFLFNFAHFVAWPPDAFASPETPFVIGVLGKDPFGPQLDAVVRGETADKRPMVVERFRNVGEIRSCNILFIGRTEARELPRIVAALKGRSILTVSDAEEAEQSGVMIRLVTQDNRIRLRIDLGAARAGNLTISSKLLRPAEIVGGGEE